MLPRQLMASHWKSGDAAHTASRTFAAERRPVSVPVSLPVSVPVCVPVRAGRATPLANSSAVISRTSVSDVAAIAWRLTTLGGSTALAFCRLPVAATM